MTASPGRKEWCRALVYLGIIAALAVFYAAVSYHAHQRFTALNGGWYGELARAFHQGQLSLLSKPSPGLLTDKNPYTAVHSYSFKWDISFYHGKYYLYFGPTPVVFLFYPWLVLSGHVLNQALAYWLICVTGLILFALFLCAAVRIYFPTAPIWIQGLLLLLFGLGNCEGYCIHFVLMYEIAAATAVTCLLAMFYLMFLSLHSEKWQVPLLVLASFFWAASVGARSTMIVYGVAFLPLFYYLLKERPGRFSPRDYVVILLPALAIGLLLAWYNFARFGNPFDFGLNYQLSLEDYHRDPRFSLSYLPVSLADILLMPPRPSLDFPYLFADPPRHTFFNPLRLSTQYVGLVFSLPVFVYGALWPSLLRPNRLRWFATTATVSGLAMLLLLSCYFSLCYHYFLDFLTPFFLITALSILACEKQIRAHFYQRCIFGGLMAYSLYFGFALALEGEINGIHTFQTYPPPVTGEQWLPDGEKTPPR